MSAYALLPPAPSNPPPTPRLPTETVFIVAILSKLFPSSSAMVPSAAVRKLAQRATIDLSSLIFGDAYVFTATMIFTS